MLFLELLRPHLKNRDKRLPSRKATPFLSDPCDRGPGMLSFWRPVSSFLCVEFHLVHRGCDGLS